MATSEATRVEATLPRYGKGEELANSVSHGVGGLLAIAGCVALVVHAATTQGALTLVSVSTYGATLVSMYAASTLYHALRTPRAKTVFRMLDHACIFLLIAGTYTPFALVSLGGALGITLAAVVWALAIAGVVLRMLRPPDANGPGPMQYILLGWLVVLVAGPLVTALPLPSLVLLIAGGVAYTAGTAFYTWQRLRFHHAVWHVWVLAGSASHFFAVWLAVSSS